MSPKRSLNPKDVEDLLEEKKIYQIINPRLVQAPSSISVKDAIDLMQNQRAGYIVIADNKKCVGIFTETDVIRKILEQDVDWNRPVREFMTPSPVTLRMEDSVGKAIETMGKYRFYHIPLVNEKGELVQVISVRTLIRFLAEFYPAEVLNLPPDPNQVMKTPEGG
jgi:CBS domain-containing protein